MHNNLTELYIQQSQKNIQARNLSSENKVIMAETVSDFEREGLPTHKGEDFRYTKVQNHLPKDLSFRNEFQFNTTAPVIGNCYTLIMLGNSLDLTRSNIPNGKVKLHVAKLDKDIDFKALHYDKEDSFDSLSLMNTEEIIQIVIDDNIQLDKPLQIIYYPLDKSEDMLFNPRISISIGQKASCEVIEYYPEGPLNCNSNLAITCNQESRLDYCKINFTQATHLGKLSVVQKESSQFKGFLFSTGSNLLRSHVKTSLIGETAHAEINGLYALCDDVHSDQFIEILHLAPKTTSDQLFKGILSDSAHGVFTGKVTIARDAQLVNANQLNKNLLLSKKARIETRPSLEVYADDVKCTHGATTGQLNEDQLFYLISRGIKKDVAYRLLIHGFIDDALNKISNKQIRHLIEENILKEFKDKIVL
jgi:Fe-S cluster assembly protein SufD